MRKFSPVEMPSRLSGTGRPQCALCVLPAEPSPPWTLPNTQYNFSLLHLLTEMTCFLRRAQLAGLLGGGATAETSLSCAPCASPVLKDISWSSARPAVLSGNRFREHRNHLKLLLLRMMEGSSHTYKGLSPGPSNPVFLRECPAELTPLDAQVTCH